MRGSRTCILGVGQYYNAKVKLTPLYTFKEGTDSNSFNTLSLHLVCERLRAQMLHHSHKILNKPLSPAYKYHYSLPPVKSRRYDPVEADSARFSLFVLNCFLQFIHLTAETPDRCHTKSKGGGPTIESRPRLVNDV